MPVRGLPLLQLYPLDEFYRRCFYHSLDRELRAGRITANINGEIISCKRYSSAAPIDVADNGEVILLVC